MIRKANHTASAVEILIAVALGLAVTPQSAAQVTGPADKISATPAATASAAKAEPTKPEWGQGVLEAEFLTKLRLFLERDPLDFKEFERVFGVRLEVHPKEGPYPDGSWGIHAVGPIPPPFGREFRGRGYGPSYSFIPTRDEKYLRIELLKPPPRGWTPESKLPCIKPEVVAAAFEGTEWLKTVTYGERRVHLAVAAYPISESYRYRQGTPDHIWLSISVDHECVPYLFVSTDRIASHPATSHPATK